MIAAGVHEDLDLEDALGVVGILYETGRSVPPRRWIEAIAAQDEANANEGYF